MKFIRFLAKMISVCVVLLLVSSCMLTTIRPDYEQDESKVRNEPGSYQDEPVILTADDILIPPIEESKIVEIYKDEIQDNCERKFIDLYNYYINGDLIPAKILFDNLLESLEYFNGDNRINDKKMLEKFWDNFSDQDIKNSDEDIFDIYQSLYFDDELFTKSTESNELVIEKKEETINVKQNNESFVYLEKEVKKIYNNHGSKASNDFIRSVYDEYISLLEDRLGVKETYIRSRNYIPFIKKKLVSNKLDEIYAYIPAVATSFYEPKKNTIWKLKGSKNINDFGAATASVISNLKKVSKNKNTLKIISAILEERRYNLKTNELNGNIFSVDMVEFIASYIILSNPEDHELAGSAIGKNTEDADYIKSYAEYLKNPKKYKSTSKKTKKTNSKYKKSFIRINYKVKKGDNLKLIANLFNVKISDLKKWNPKDTSKKYLYPGMILVIKGYKFQYYKVRSGDSLGKICNKFKMKQKDFKKINNLSKNTVYKGRKYIVKKR